MADQQLKIDVVLKNFASKELAVLDKSLLGFTKRGILGFQSIAKSVFSLKGLLVGLGAGFAVRGISRMVKDVADAADNIRDLSIAVGVSTETLSVLEQVAEKGGSGLNELKVGFRTLQTAVGEFTTTGRGAIHDVITLMSPAFAKLVRDGGSAEEIFKQISREMGNLSAAERVFVSSKLFGRGGAKLLPILTRDLDEATASMKRFGIVISKEAAAHSDDFNDALLELKLSFVGIQRQVVFEILPALTKATKEFVDVILDNKPAILKTIANLIDGIGFLGKAAFNIAAGFSVVSSAIHKLIIQSEILKMTGADILTPPVMGLSFVDMIMGKKPEDGAARLKRLNEELLKVGDEADDAADAWRKLGDTWSSSADKASAAVDGLADAQHELGPSTTENIKAFKRAQVELLGFTRTADLAKTAVVELTEAEVKANLELFHKQDAMQGLRDGFNDLRQASQEWGVATRHAVNAVADALADNVSSGFLDVIEGTKSAKEAFRDMTKGILKDLARIIVRLLVVKAIELTLGALGGGFKDLKIGLPAGSEFKAGAEPFRHGGIVPGHLEPIRGHLQRGGIVRRPGLFEIAEGGQAEAVIPLLNGTHIPTKNVGSRGRGGGGAPTVIINSYYSANFLDGAHERQFLHRNAKTMATLVGNEIRQSPAIREAFRAA